MSVGLRGIAGVLGPQEIGLADLVIQNRVSSSERTLSAFGFERVYVAEHPGAAQELACQAAESAMQDANVSADEIDLVIWASARAENHLHVSEHQNGDAPHVLDGFRYCAGWLQDRLSLRRADVMAVAQQGCTTMFSALRMARAVLLTEPHRQHALCVGVDVLPPGGCREIMYNVISDAATAAVVSRDSPQDKWIGYRQLSRGYYWDPRDRHAEILAAYFPTSKIVIEQLLADCRLTPGEIDVVVPTGVNHKSWEILLDLVGIPADRLKRGMESFGHSILADNLIYLRNLRATNQLERGAKMLLFTYGFGSSWCGLVLEH
jgi:3-oxoacyl-[acyl-carrier-protein] synthase III